jgi:hypothetical protein
MMLAAVLAACSGGGISDADHDDGPGASGAGTFRATITGGLQLTVEGAAAFTSTAASANPQGFLLQMNGLTNGAFNQRVFTITRVGGRRPGVGSMAIQDLAAISQSQNGLYATFSAPDGGGGSQSGTLTITSSVSGRLQGTATFMAIASTQGQNNVNVTVSITFDATCSVSCD